MKMNEFLPRVMKQAHLKNKVDTKYAMYPMAWIEIW